MSTCYCDRNTAGHEWSLDEGCTRRPVTTEPDLLRDAIRRELSEWEVFLDADGDRSIRRRDGRTPDEVTDAVLALPELRRLRQVTP